MADFNNKKINFALPLAMETALPLDHNSVFTSLDAAIAAARTASEIGSVTSRYYFGQNVVVADKELGVYKTYRIQPDGTLKELAAEYVGKDGIAETIGQDGITYFGLSATIFDRINTSYITLSEKSDEWSNSYSTVRSLSGRWEKTSNNFDTLSAKNDSVYGTVSTLSAGWDSAYVSLTNNRARWNSAYSVVNSTSGTWKDAYTRMQTFSARWNNASTVIETTSANNASIYSIVSETSATWDSAVENTGKILEKLPSDVWIEGNEVADKTFVETKIQENLGTFRGSFNNWSQVPKNASGYNIDKHGNRVPLENDYIIVLDDSQRTMTVSVQSNPVGEIIAEEVVSRTGQVIFTVGHQLVTNDILTLNAYSIDSVVVYRTGSWRFKFVGVWVEGSESSRDNWKVEYRINNTSFTAAQLNALNSGINSNKVRTISVNEYNIGRLGALSGIWNSTSDEVMKTSGDYRGLFTTVTDTSATWDLVLDKVDQDFFKYYAASAWNLLTDEESDYSRVPEGLIFIYEEDSTPAPIPQASLSIYTGSDGVLTLSRNIVYDEDFGTLYIGGTATFNPTSYTLTIPGSSDVAGASSYDKETGVFTFSPAVTWTEETGEIILTTKDKYESETGILTINSEGGSAPRDIFTVRNILQNAYNSNTVTIIRLGSSYNAKISPLAGYELKSVICKMGDEYIDVDEGFNISITNVTSDIVITAIAEISGTTTYNVTYSLIDCTSNVNVTTVQHGSSITFTIIPKSTYRIVSKSCIMGVTQQVWDGDSVTIDFVTDNIQLIATAVVDSSVRTEYYTSTNTIRLGNDTTYDSVESLLTLGDSVAYNEGTLLFRGVSMESPSYKCAVEVVMHNNVTWDNQMTEIDSGLEFEITFSPVSDDYKITSATCRMGGVIVHNSTDGHILISEVLGDLQFFVVAERKGRNEYDDETGTFMFVGTYSTDNNEVVVDTTVASYDSLINALTFETYESPAPTPETQNGYDPLDASLSIVAQFDADNMALDVDNEKAEFDSVTKTLSLTK